MSLRLTRPLEYGHQYYGRRDYVNGRQLSAMLGGESVQLEVPDVNVAPGGWPFSDPPSESDVRESIAAASRGRVPDECLALDDDDATPSPGTYDFKSGAVATPFFEHVKEILREDLDPIDIVNTDEAVLQLTFGYGGQAEWVIYRPAIASKDEVVASGAYQHGADYRLTWAVARHELIIKLLYLNPQQCREWASQVRSGRLPAVIDLLHSVVGQVEEGALHHSDDEIRQLERVFSNTLASLAKTFTFVEQIVVPITDRHHFRRGRHSMASMRDSEFLTLLHDIADFLMNSIQFLPYGEDGRRRLTSSEIRFQLSDATQTLLTASSMEIDVHISLRFFRGCIPSILSLLRTTFGTQYPWRL